MQSKNWEAGRALPEMIDALCAIDHTGTRTVPGQLHFVSLEPDFPDWVNTGRWPQLNIAA